MPSAHVDAGTPLALSLPPAPASCGSRFYTHENPTFCIHLPAGFAVDLTSHQYLSFSNGFGRDQVIVSWNTPISDFKNVVAQIDQGQGDAVRRRENLPGGRGVVWLLSTPDATKVWARAMIQGEHHVFECQSSAVQPNLDAAPLLEACQTLLVSDDPGDDDEDPSQKKRAQDDQAHAVADLFTSEATDLNVPSKWSACARNDECVDLKSPCGESVAAVNKRFEAVAIAAWRKACNTGGATATVKTFPAHCRANRCAGQRTLGEQIEGIRSTGPK